MLTQREDVEVHALKERGWSISAIARHTGRDRKTIRAYLNGERRPGERKSCVPDALEPFVEYLRLRFSDDPHLWATALFDEVVILGYRLSYPSFVRQVRTKGLRPHCEACHGVKGRDHADIEHPAGEEIQWDWFERRNAPWGQTAYILLGTLPHSSRVRGTICESLDQPHLIEGIDAVMRKLGGTARAWRTDRLATVIVPGTADVQPSFAPVAKYYGVAIEPCPPRRGNRKGAVESSGRFVSGRWWRTMTAKDPVSAEASLDRFCSTIADGRVRRNPDGQKTTVGALAETEPLRPLPAVPYPAEIEVTRVVAANALVSFRGNSYAVPPGLSGSSVTVRHRLSGNDLTIHLLSGTLLATHRVAPKGAGATVRTFEQRQALETAVLSAFTTERPCDRKSNRPPGPEALQEAKRILGSAGEDVVVDLESYQRVVDEMGAKGA
jgi:transposase